MIIRSAKTAAVLTAILLCFCTSELMAQYELILSSGITLPIKDKRTGLSWDTGYNFGAELIFPNDDSILRFSVDLNYIRSPLRRFDNISSVVTAMGNLTVVIPTVQSGSVFISGGFGMFRLHSEVPRIHLGFQDNFAFSTIDETTAGFKIGVGFDIPLNRKNSIVMKVHYLIGTLNESFNPLIPITIGWKVEI